jgi:PAS domain S-box-containing protein
MTPTIFLSGDVFFGFMICLILLLFFLLLYCTQLRRSLSKHRKKQIALEQDGRMLHQVFDALPDHVYYKDRQARLIGINPACCKHHGATSADDLIGKTDAEFKPMPAGRVSYELEMRQMAENKTIRNCEEYPTGDGSVCHVENIKQPLLDPDGKVIGLVGITRDISKQIEYEKSLQNARQEAEDASKAKSSFLAMMSHEIRTPMHGVIGAASLLQQTPLTPDQKSIVSTIESSGESLMTILNDILDYSKIEAGRVELEMIPFSLHGCVHEALNLFTMQAEEKNIELLLFIEPGVPESLAGDPNRVRQILINLLSNALKFTAAGEICVQVQLVPQNDKVDHPHLQFSVRDTGVGIPEDARKRLFQPFEQADVSNTRRFGGTGLGLVISRRLTQLMGGDMWFKTKEGEGTTFYFTIDLPISAMPMKEKGTPPPNGLTGKRILLVDDNATNRKILSSQMDLWGAESVALPAPDGVLDHLKKEAPYDLLILDYNMPGMTGVALAKKVFYDEQVARVPIMLLSSSYEEITHHPAISCRINKPVQVKKLHSKIIDLLSVKQTTPPKPKEESKASAEDNSTRILLAEDNDENRKLIEQMIRVLGYNKVNTVADGKQALEACCQQEYDIVLMDIQMPNMSGLEATRAIREHTGLRDKPWVVALTAGVTQEERQEIADAGLNEVLPKPMTITALQQTLQQAKEKITTS